MPSEIRNRFSSIDNKRICSLHDESGCFSFLCKSWSKKERPTEDFYDRNMTQKAELIDTRAVKKK